MTKTIKIKAYVVVRNGKIIMDSFYTKQDNKVLLAIFPKQKVNQYSPLWGYALKKEHIEEVEITLKGKIVEEKYKK